MTQAIQQTIVINAPDVVVWDALTSIDRMAEWMADPEMQVRIDVDWAVGNRILIRGFHHVAFVNTGTVLEFEPVRRLTYTHLSSLSGLPDVPRSHTTVSFSLRPSEGTTVLEARITGFPTEIIFNHLQLYWRGTLPLLKEHAERPISPASRSGEAGA